MIKILQMFLFICITGPIMWAGRVIGFAWEIFDTGLFWGKRTCDQWYEFNERNHADIRKWLAGKRDAS